MLYKLIFNFYTSKVYFVDKQRNAAVVIGDRDLKTDVKNKKKRERFVRKMP